MVIARRSILLTLKTNDFVLKFISSQFAENFGERKFGARVSDPS